MAAAAPALASTAPAPLTGAVSTGELGWTAAAPRTPPAGAHDEFKAWHTTQMRSRIKTVLKDCTGLSFDERCRIASKEYRKRTKLVEDHQKHMLEEAIRRAKAHPTNSPFREAALEPATIEERYRVNGLLRKQKEAEFARQAAETKKKLDTREPIFRVSEVQKAFEEQRQRAVAHRRELAEEEAQRWEHIRELQKNVHNRPCCVEDYARPEHIRSAPELRLIPEHSKKLPMQLTMLEAIGHKDYLDSAWGKEVDAIRARQDSRKKLSEIQYPPKVYPPKPLGQRALLPIEVAMKGVVAQPWFQKSDWADKVREIKQRMDERPKLHEISYPPKHPPNRPQKH